jgi:Domain of unknown function (DUF4178)
VAEPAPQRRYEAPCPGCGAPVAFLSAQSTHAVCAYCHSSVVRQADALARLGRVADEFTDYSPLKIGASGSWRGKAFTLVGRLQLGDASSRWTEWQAVFDDQSLGSLSEDNGGFVFSVPHPAPSPMPPFEGWRVGATQAISGQLFVVSVVRKVALLAAQGELGHLPGANALFGVVELRDEQGRVCSMDYGSEPASVWMGSEVRLADLAITGLDRASVRKDSARHFNCPRCAARLEVKLDTTQSMTCPSCDSLIDLSAGIGGELRHAVQDEPIRPLIPLGTSGTLKGAAWQVVGFQHRMGRSPDDDETFGWTEYLLYNRAQGFCFLVDSEEGWSVVKPATGAPKVASGGQTASYLGKRYTRLYTYDAETQYVAGEFYWKVERGQKTTNTDFAEGKNLLSLEKSAEEWTWSVGERIDSAAVAKAFGLEQKAALFTRSDVSPLSASAGGIGVATGIGVVLFIAVVWWLMSSRDCDPKVENCSSRWSSGSFGGSSSGGWHK